ncbi:MAG: hypothetical protein Q9162_006707 [Coniocarpon cinnabarinum]
MLFQSVLHAALLATFAASLPTSQYGDDQSPLLLNAKPSSRKLTGNFLHITDLHPDPFYVTGSDPSQACHHGHGSAGPLGAEKTDCDSPIPLVNATFDWLAHNLADKIDFVIWTGDSARHDNDDRHFPRNKSQVLSQNRLLVEKFREVWGKEGAEGANGEFKIPIVPNLGNNDILPHNIFAAGPNSWTHDYLQIWKRLIPEPQRHSFARGGWYFVEVVPNRLAVFSLNTLYFFGNNYLVDGCDDKDEPGYEQFEWLRVQLQMLRERGVKAILTGHVPPARNEEKEMWTDSCWMKYALWLQQYRDVIIGSAWGHMNVEHFFLQDFNEIVWETDADTSVDEDDLSELQDVTQVSSATELRRRSSSDDLEAQVKPPNYLNALREQWSALPSSPAPISNPSKHSRKTPEDRYQDAIGGEHAERFAMSFVSASVVPNFYPTLRLFKYNITGLEDASVQTAEDMLSSASPGKNVDSSHLENWNDIDAQVQLQEADAAKKKKHKKKHKPHKGKKLKPRFPIPAPPSSTSPPGPAYSQQALSWLGYTQLFANLTHIKRNLSEPRRLREFQFEAEYNTLDDDDVYGLSPTEGDGVHGGITVRNLLELAGRIGSYHPEKNDLLESELPESDEQTGDSTQDGEGSDDEADEDEEDSDEESDNEDDIAISKKKKSKKGKKDKKHKRKKQRRKIINKTWYAFVDRALVGTVPAEELHKEFGQVIKDRD